MVDFQGQQLAERLMPVFFLLFCIPGWIMAYREDDFTYAFNSWTAACAASCLVR